MRTTLMAALCALVCTAGQATAGQDDDWEFAEDPAQQLTVAAARYDGGQMIVAQCRRGGLTLLVTGLPQGEEVLRLAATRADGRAAAQIWVPLDAPGTYRSVSPGREARFMRGGGAYVVRSAAGSPTPVSATFDLPAQSANLDRVLTACGWALEDDRDLLEDTVVLLDRPSRRSEPRPYRPPSVPEREVSCIVRDMRLRDCRPDHPPYAEASNFRSVLRAVQNQPVYVPIGADPATTEGKVFRVIASDQLLVVVNR